MAAFDRRAVPALLLGLPLLLSCAAEPSAEYRVWAADQNRDIVYVLAPDGAPVDSLDLGRAIGASRPHTIHPAPDGSILFSANTVSNQASVHGLPDGEALAVVDAVGKAPHAVQPHPDRPDRAYVSNIAPRGETEDGGADRGETITEIRREADGGWRVHRVLDLAAEPELAGDVFPSRRPVLVGFSADGRTMLVTLFDGGVAAVDLEAWRVVRAWGPDRIARHATVIIPGPDRRELFVTAGSEDASWLYVFDVSAEPQLVASHDLARWGRDAHGAAVDRERGELWVVHRASGTITVHPLDRIRESHEPGVVDLGDETPDLVEIGPDARFAYVTLRGPDPAPTIPFPLTGRTPGIAVIDVAERRPVRVVPLSDPERGDFHGLAIVEAMAN